ncbi:LIM domain and actin-binding protein 1, partial [Pseudolycoriella hygida]
STTIKTVGGVTTTTKISTMTKTTQQRTTSSAQNIQQQKTVEQKVTAKSGQTTNKEEFNQISAKSNVDSSQTNHQNSKHLQRQNASTTKPQPSHTEDICVRCDRTVYKMEEVIAEQQVWHKNCFRCKECNKPL